jgi:citrate synthase
MKRLSLIKEQISSNKTSNASDEITITDNRNGKTYKFKLMDGLIKASDIASIKDKNGAPLRSYDPAYMNTVNCTSTICYIDGEKGLLEYRGIPIEQLASKSNFIEVAYLLIFGNLPSNDQWEKFNMKVCNHTYIHADLEAIIRSFRYDAHPMGMLGAAIQALSTLHPEANPSLKGEKIFKDNNFVNKQIFRILGNLPTIAAYCYRHRIGKPFVQPRNDLGYIENFLYMLDYLNDVKYNSHPTLIKALEILFILHAEHELNCSTAAVRHLQSSGVDIYSCIAGGVSALYGPKHGGANEAVLRMLDQIQTVDNIPAYIKSVKERKTVLFGFGHRVYKSYDPRAKIVKGLADEVFSVFGKEPLIEVAMELERIALTDKYFIDKKLYPNVDFYTGVIYKAMGFPTDMFPVLFSIPRTAGWLAHFVEFNNDNERKIVRPRQNYKGLRQTNYTEMKDRVEVKSNLHADESSFFNRRRISVPKYAKK